MNKAKKTLSVHHSPLTRRYPFSIIHDLWLMEDGNGKCMVNSKWKMVNGAGGGLK